MHHFCFKCFSVALHPLIVFLLFQASFLSAQTVRFDPVSYNVTTEHGLPSMETYSVKQDSQGYIWICTDGGVCRYDGYEFKTYSTQDGLFDNVVFDTYEDAKGRIWFNGIDTRLCYYEKGKIHAYQYNHLLKPFLKEQLEFRKFLCVGNDGTVYYSILGLGLIVIHPDGKLERRYNGPNQVSISKETPEPMYTRHRDTSTWDLKSSELVPIIHALNGKEMKVDGISQWGNKYFGKLSNGRVFMASGELMIDVTTGKVCLNNHELLFMTIVNDEFWLGTMHGLIRAKWDEQKQELINQEHYFKELQVSSVAFTKDGNCWLTSLKNGAFFCGDLEIEYTAKDLGLNSNNVIDIVRFQDRLLVSSISGIQSIDGPYPSGVERIATYGSAKMEECNGALFVASGNSGARHLKRISDKVTATAWLSDLQVLHGEFYATSVLLMRFDLQKTTQEYLSSPIQESSENFRGTLNCLTGDDSGAIYVGTSSGVLKKVGDTWSQVNIGKKTDYKIRVLNYHKDIGLIIGTMNNGVIIKKGNHIIRVGEREGLLNMKVNALRVLSNGWLLIGSSKGISIYDPVKNQVFRLTQNDCMRALDVNTIYLDGEDIYIGTENGLFRVKETVLIKKALPVPQATVRIENIQIDGDRIDGLQHELYFPFDANLLKVDFSVLQFDNWFSKKFQYRIGEDGGWIDITSPSINLYRPSGEFDLEIRYMDADFQWSDPVKLCHVQVLMPFWKQFYFWAIIGLAVFILLLFTLQRRQNRINQRLIRENQILQLEQQMLLHEQQMEHARMNPHFIFNVLNSIHSFILHEETNEAEKYLMMFSRLMREILVNTREGSVSVGDECSVLLKYLELEQLRFKGNFGFKVEVNPDDLNLFIPTMFVQPFIENAVIHGVGKRKEPNSEIILRFEHETHQCMKVTICNSGVISDEDRKRLNASRDKNAFGITKKRLENYNTLLKTDVYGLKLEVMREPLPKTCIILRIPIL